MMRHRFLVFLAWMCVYPSNLLLAGDPTTDKPNGDTEASRDSSEKYLVTVYKSVDGAWQAQPERAYRTDDPLKALRYWSSVRVVSGWKAETNATYDIAHFRTWEYARDNDGRRGYFAKREGKEWIEAKDGSLYATFEEINRTPEYVEIYDKSRDMSLRLYATEVQWTTPNHDSWYVLPFSVTGF